MISLIVAQSSNGVIGQDGELPWHLPDDLRYFRDTTRGHTVIMGRRTYESIVARLGHGLPDRTNIVLTRDASYATGDATVVHTVDEALAHATRGAFVVGGSQIYKLMLPVCDRLYITEVHTEITGDAHFPTLSHDQWREVSRTPHAADERHMYSFDFVVYDRVG